MKKVVGKDQFVFKEWEIAYLSWLVKKETYYLE
jgi:hypothetical protein